MKTNIFIFAFLFLSFLHSAFGQSPTLTGFNGRINFSGFANNGSFVRGTLKDFNDQTGQYTVSGINVGDVAWDNNGKRYVVAVKISSTGTQATVDLTRIGGGTHIPKGAGFISRETSNGLALVPPVNSTGISTQLSSRVGVHNAKILEGLKYLPYNLLPSTVNNRVNILKWTGNGSTAVPSFGYRYAGDTIVGNVLLKMPSYLNYEDVTFAIGDFPFFPNYSTSGSMNGLLVSPYNEDGNYLITYHSGQGNSLYTSRSRLILKNISGVHQTSALEITKGKVLLSAHSIATPISLAKVELDSSGFYYTAIGSIKLRVMPSAIPSSAINTKYICTWSGTGSDLVPSYTFFQSGLVTGTTDGSGDLTVTFATSVPDATYTMVATVEGTTSYTISVHTKATGTCKVRFFNPATGAAVTATSVTISYEAKDY